MHGVTRIAQTVHGRKKLWTKRTTHPHARCPPACRQAAHRACRPGLSSRGTCLRRESSARAAAGGQQSAQAQHSRDGYRSDGRPRRARQLRWRRWRRRCWWSGGVLAGCAPPARVLQRRAAAPPAAAAHREGPHGSHRARAPGPPMPSRSSSRRPSRRRSSRRCPSRRRSSRTVKRKLPLARLRAGG